MNLCRAYYQLSRFFKHWVSFAGLFFAVGSCPCCGGQACPASAGIIGFVLALGSLLKHAYQWTREFFTSLSLKIKGEGS